MGGGGRGDGSLGPRLELRPGERDGYDPWLAGLTDISPRWGTGCAMSGTGMLDDEGMEELYGWCIMGGSALAELRFWRDA